MDVADIKQKLEAHDLIHTTAIKIRELIDYAVSETSMVLEGDIEEMIKELVFD
jgi:hypothetical protein